MLRSKDLEKWISGATNTPDIPFLSAAKRNILPPVPPHFHDDYEKVKQEYEPVFAAPSGYPNNAVIPKDPEVIETIVTLKKLESQIPTMPLRQLNNQLWPCTQHLQSYGLGHEVDDRLLKWAATIAEKVTLRRQLVRQSPYRRHRFRQAYEKNNQKENNQGTTGETNETN